MADNTILYLEIAKTLTYSAVSFLLALWWAPLLIKLLNWAKFWKKKTREVASTGEDLVVTKKFYQENEGDRLVPRAGGILIWVTTLVLATFFWIVLKIEPTSKVSQFLNFVSRQETFIPLGTLFFGSMIGLIDDALVTMEGGGNYKAGGLKLSYRLIFISILSLIIGFWFHFRLDFHKIYIFNWILDLQQLQMPFNMGSFGWLIIPIIILVLIGTWSSGIIDGLDGLAAGVIIPIYLCFAGLSFARGFYDIATFLMVMVGATCAYLWFNISPAKFFLGDTGAVGLLLTIAVVSVLINYIYILPIAGFILVITSLSAVIQVGSKKIFKKKVFLAAPFHHHLEAMGWTRSQITYRYWLLSILTSSIALVIGLIFK